MAVECCHLLEPHCASLLQRSSRAYRNGTCAVGSHEDLISTGSNSEGRGEHMSGSFGVFFLFMSSDLH